MAAILFLSMSMYQKAVSQSTPAQALTNIILHQADGTVVDGCNNHLEKWCY
jgi:hypothetical protein